MKIKYSFLVFLFLVATKLSATEVAVTEVDGQWRTIAISGSYTDPVVFAGVPTNKDKNPGVIKIRNVTTTSFDIKFENWGYLLDQGLVHGTETVPYLILERGRSELADKSIWEVGVVDVGYSRSVRFDQAFDSTPIIIVSPQSEIEGYTSSLHPRSITKNGFAITQRQQIANYDTEGRKWAKPYQTYKVAYLAIQAPTRTANRDGFSYELSVDGVSHMNSPIVGEYYPVYFQEEQSTNHSATRIENDVSGLALDGKLFASDAQYLDGTGSTLRIGSWENSYRDCQDALAKGKTKNGYYVIDPDGDGGVDPFSVYCEQETLGGGWILVAHHHDKLAVKEAVSPVRPNDYGVMPAAQWQAVRDNFTSGMMFIDEFDKVSMISKPKLLNASLFATPNVEDLTKETYFYYHKNDDNNLKTLLMIRPGDNSYPASASVYQMSTVKFDVWPYTREYSYKDQDEMRYFIK